MMPKMPIYTFYILPIFGPWGISICGPPRSLVCDIVTRTRTVNRTDVTEEKEGGTTMRCMR
jgi:hypothetical protein